MCGSLERRFWLLLGVVHLVASIRRPGAGRCQDRCKPIHGRFGAAILGRDDPVSALLPDASLVAGLKSVRLVA